MNEVTKAFLNNVYDGVKANVTKELNELIMKNFMTKLSGMYTSGIISSEDYREFAKSKGFDVATPTKTITRAKKTPVGDGCSTGSLGGIRSGC
jgi:hypothetical protein